MLQRSTFTSTMPWTWGQSGCECETWSSIRVRMPNDRSRPGCRLIPSSDFASWTEHLLSTLFIGLPSVVLHEGCSILVSVLSLAYRGLVI